MNNLFIKKYLKYKQKYINLKNKQYSGSSFKSIKL